MQLRWWKLGILTTVIGLAASLPSCSDDDDDDDDTGDAGDVGDAGSGNAPGRGGSGGASGGLGGSGGTGLVAEPVPCGDVVCTPTSTGAGPMIPACCFDAATDRCGLDTALLATLGVDPTRPCEPLDQPGEADASCPNSEPVMIGMTMLPPFQGCCREETGECGYLINTVGGLIPIGLGCVEASSFGDEGATPVACGSGSGGSAGSDSGGSDSGGSDSGGSDSGGAGGN